METTQIDRLIRELITSLLITLGVAVVITIGITIFIIRSVKNSIAKGQVVAEALAEGDFTVEVQAGKDEIGQLVEKLWTSL